MHFQVETFFKFDSRQAYIIELNYIELNYIYIIELKIQKF